MTTVDPSRQTVERGEAATISVTVTNTGDAEAVGGVVLVTVASGERWCELSLPAVAPDGSTSVECVREVVDETTEVRVDVSLPFGEMTLEAAPVTTRVAVEAPASTEPAAEEPTASDPTTDDEPGPGAPDVDERDPDDGGPASDPGAVGSADPVALIGLSASPEYQEVPPGQSASVSVTVHNLGNVEVGILSPEQGPGYAGDGCAAGATVTGKLAGPLAAGATRTVTCTFTNVTERIWGPSGLIVGAASCSGCPTLVMASGGAWQIEPMLSPVKVVAEPARPTITPGDDLEVVLYATNTANAAVHDVSVAFPGYPKCNRSWGTVGPGDANRRVLRCKLTWGEDFVDSLTLEGEVRSTTPGIAQALRRPVSASYNVERPSGLELSVQPDAVSLPYGGTAEVDVTVRNPLPWPVSDLEISEFDTSYSDDCGPPRSLAAGAQIVVRCKVGPVTTSAIASFWPSGTFQPCPTCAERYTTRSGSGTLALQVAPNPLSFVASPAGQLVPRGAPTTIALELYNRGTAPLTDLRLEAYAPATANCRGPLADLAPGARRTVTCALAWGQATSLYETFTVTGTGGGAIGQVTAQQTVAVETFAGAAPAPTGVTLDIEPVQAPLAAGEDAYFDVSLVFPPSFPATTPYALFPASNPELKCNGSEFGDELRGRPAGGRMDFRCVAYAGSDFVGSFRAEMFMRLAFNPFSASPTVHLLSDAAQVDVVAAEGLRLDVEPLVDPLPIDEPQRYRVTATNEGPNPLDEVAVKLHDRPAVLAMDSQLREITDCTRSLGRLASSGSGATKSFTCTASVDQRTGFTVGRASAKVGSAAAAATQAVGDPVAAATQASYGRFEPVERWDVSAKVVNGPLAPGQDAILEVKLRHLNPDVDGRFDYYQTWSDTAPGCGRQVLKSQLVVAGGERTFTYQCTLRWGVDFEGPLDVEIRAYGVQCYESGGDRRRDGRATAADIVCDAISWWLGSGESPVVPGVIVTTTTTQPTTTTTTTQPTTTTTTTTTTTQPTTTTTATTTPPTVPPTTPPTVPPTTPPTVPPTTPPVKADDPPPPAEPITATTSTTQPVEPSTTTTTRPVPAQRPDEPEEITELALPAEPDDPPPDAEDPPTPVARERIVAQVAITQSTRPFAMVTVIVALVAVLLIGARPAPAERRAGDGPVPPDPEEIP